MLLQCRSWGKFWQAPTFSDFAPANSTNYTVRSGFLVGTVTNGDGAEGIEIAYDSADDFKAGTGFPTFKVPLPTGSATWRLDSRHKIFLRLRYPNNGYSDTAAFTVRKGNNRDINGDGYPDLVVGGDLVNSNMGRAYVFISRGKSGVATQNATAASAIISGQNTGEALGVSTAMDDINGDGYADLAIGANQYGSGIGRVYILYSRGVSGIATLGANDSAVVKIDGQAAPCALGYSVAAGDINGDGYADVVAGAYNDGSGGVGTNGGHTYIFLSGGKNGISNTTASAAHTNLAGETAQTSYFGHTLALGDFNADGYADLAVSAPIFSAANPNTGRVYVFFSGASGIPSQPATNGTYWTAPTAAPPESFGIGLASGDFNGDGFSDLTAGAHGTGTNVGEAYIFLSQPGFSGGATASANHKLGGEAAADYFGFSVAFGDVNGDGYSDWFVHAQQTPTGNSKGYIFHSHKGALSATSAAQANTIVTGENDQDFLGAYSSLYDINADGYDDLMLAAYPYPGGTNTGRVYTYLFSPGAQGIASGSAAGATAIITGEAGSRFGRSIPY